MAGLHFNKTGTAQNEHMLFIHGYVVKQLNPGRKTGDQPYSDTYPNGESSMAQPIPQLYQIRLISV